MNVWIVNPFDPLPGDPEQEGRYATLARILASRGHGVCWWTSSFSHRFKQPVDEAVIQDACSRCGIAARFLKGPPYSRNVGAARVWNHFLLSRRFTSEARTVQPAPDVILASSPPPGLALAAVRAGGERGARVIIDVQDLWPDNFLRLAPRALRSGFGLLLRPSFEVARQAYSACDAVVGVADAYAQRALELAGTGKPTATFPLGVDLQAFDAAVRAGACPQWTRPPGEIWLAYTGSLTRNYDFLTVVRTAVRLRQVRGQPVRFIITGRGECAKEAERIARQEGLTHLALTGFLDFNTWAYLLSQCQAGFNAALPEALIYLPNKFFYYLAAGLAILNTIPGQCSRIVEEGRCGRDYRAGDVGSCVQAIKSTLSDPQESAAMGRAARHLAQTTYDRGVLYPRYADFIEQSSRGAH